MAFMSRPTRLTLLAIAATIVVLILAAIVAVYILMQPQRVTNMLRDQARQAGMQLTLSSPAEPTLWPRPALVLHGLTLSVDNRPVLVAARARLALPWRTLLGGPTAITRLELDNPQINLAQLGPVLANMNHGTSANPSLLRINTGIHLNHGSLRRGSTTLLDDVQMETGPLVPGQVFNLQLSAMTTNAQHLKLSLRMTPHETSDSLSLDDIRLTAAVQPNLAMSMHGQAKWQGSGDISMALSGDLVHNIDHRYAMALKLAPPTADAPLLFNVKLHGEGMAADLSLSPTQLSDWWARISQADDQTGLPLPPVQGTLQAKQLDLGDMHIQGLQIVTGDATATASSAPAPASSTSVK